MSLLYYTCYYKPQNIEGYFKKKFPCKFILPFHPMPLFILSPGKCSGLLQVESTLVCVHTMYNAHKLEDAADIDLSLGSSPWNSAYQKEKEKKKKKKVRL